MASQIGAVAFFAALSAQRKLYAEQKASALENAGDRKRAIGLEVVRQLQSRARPKSAEKQPSPAHLSPDRPKPTHIQETDTAVARPTLSPVASVTPSSPSNSGLGEGVNSNAQEKRRKGGEIVSLDVSFGRKPPLHPNHAHLVFTPDSTAGDRDGQLEGHRRVGKEPIEVDDSIMGDRPNAAPRSFSSVEGSVFTAVSRLAQRRRLSGGAAASSSTSSTTAGIPIPDRSTPGRSTPGQRRRETRIGSALSEHGDVEQPRALPKPRMSLGGGASAAGSSSGNPFAAAGSSSGDTTASYAGTVSNRKLIINALTYVSLAGGTYDETRNAVLNVLRSHSATHFFVALKRFKFVGLYVPWPDASQAAGETPQASAADDLSVGAKAIRVFGEGPLYLHDTSIDAYYKYDSAGKQWKSVHAYGLNPSIDAVNIIPQQARRRAAAAAAAAATAAAIPSQVDQEGKMNVPLLLGNDNDSMAGNE